MCKVDDALLFSEVMAKELIKEVELATAGNPRAYEIVAHCRAGVARSSATFIALNEIYSLGYENQKELFH